MPSNLRRLCEDVLGRPRVAAQRLAEACAPRRKDYYDILKVPKGAADSVIKRSYRKLALQYHPVRSPPGIPRARRRAADGAPLAGALRAGRRQKPSLARRTR